MVQRIKPKQQSSDETTIKQILDEKTVEENEAMRAHRKNKKRSLYASDYGQCMQKIWYKFFPEEYPTEELSPRVLRIFHNGESVHERLARYLKRADIGFIEEIDVPRDELDVHGRCDGLCTLDARPVVIEFKSINRRHVTEPKEEHIGQLMWYMEMWRMRRNQLRESFGIHDNERVTHERVSDIISTEGKSFEELPGIERWLLLTDGEIVGELIYESKQTQKTDHFSIPYDPVIVNKVRKWFQTLQKHIDTRTRPDVDYDKDAFPCSWGRGKVKAKCPYYAQCWGEGKNNMAQD